MKEEQKSFCSFNSNNSTTKSMCLHNIKGPIFNSTSIYAERAISTVKEQYQHERAISTVKEQYQHERAISTVKEQYQRAISTVKEQYQR
ncbi:hypothetical protein H8356DRAFT_1418956 [Neocallimastix lanati (nom. inval.)]|nr:hypothetical protein H8356DRAFT_1418956 [Neocallimastix sp. JGI-2020a]